MSLAHPTGIPIIRVALPRASHLTYHHPLGPGGPCMPRSIFLPRTAVRRPFSQARVSVDSWTIPQGQSMSRRRGKARRDQLSIDPPRPLCTKSGCHCDSLGAPVCAEYSDSAPPECQWARTKPPIRSKPVLLDLAHAINTPAQRTSDCHHGATCRDI